MAAGPAEPDATQFTVSAKLGSDIYGILSNPFLDRAFKTVEFTIKVTANQDGTWSYEETTFLQIPGRDDVFNHIDRNTLTRVAEPMPNPLAR
jgi:hypothetical protein